MIMEAQQRADRIIDVVAEGVGVVVSCSSR
jgi:hypothetical protein